MVLEEESRSNLLFPASHCPVCQHALRAWENIPLLSWLALRGTLSLLQVADYAAVIFTRAVDGVVLWPHRPVDTGLSIPFLAVGAGGLSAAAGDD